MPGACSRADAWQTGHIRRTPRQSRAAPQRSDLSAGLIALQGEPCVDGMAGGCRELAHGQTHDSLDTYGECRDSHELLCSEVTCRQGSLRYKVSHAWTGWQADAGSLLTGRRMADWPHTANAATVTSCPAAK